LNRYTNKHLVSSGLQSILCPSIDWFSSEIELQRVNCRLSSLKQRKKFLKLSILIDEVSWTVFDSSHTKQAQRCSGSISKPSVFHASSPTVAIVSFFWHRKFNCSQSFDKSRQDELQNCLLPASGGFFCHG
jgi:hypothetical protein